MHEACKLCRGACCEAIILPEVGRPDVDRWIALHGQVQPDGWVVLPVRCRALVDGRCSIYEGRPQVCADFQPGGTSCRQSIMRGRTAGKAERILALL